MSVALSDVRFQIQDQPRSVGVAPESPRAVGTVDGQTTTFFLPIGRLQYVAGSAALYWTPAGGGSPTGVSAATYAISQQGAIIFTSAPGSGTSPAIPNGSLITAAYQTTAFADADLAGVLARNVATYGASGDEYVLKACHLDIIGIKLGDVELLAAITEAEYKRDPAAVTASLQKQQGELRTQLQGQPRPGQAIPAMIMRGARVHPYQPVR
jgi:hypothetical protein